MGTIRNIYNNDKSLEISEEQIANTFTIGSNWKWLRLGLVYQVSSSAATISSHIFGVGVCSGTASLLGSAAGPTYFVGISTTPCTLTYAAALPAYPYYYNGSSNTLTGYQVGTSFSSSGAGGSTLNHPPISGSTAIYYPLYLDFIKTVNDTTNQTWRVILTSYREINSTQTPSFYSTTTDFYTQLTNITASGPTGQIPAENGGQWARYDINVPVSESVYGSLDSINIFWNKTIPLEIYEIAAYQFS